jgi:hypothetical protein
MFFLTSFHTSRDGSVGIATGYWLDDWDSIHGRGKKFSLLHSIWNSSGARTASYAIYTRGYFLGHAMNTGIVSSNPTQGMDICVCVYSVSV